MKIIDILIHYFMYLLSKLKLVNFHKWDTTPRADMVSVAFNPVISRHRSFSISRGLIRVLYPFILIGIIIGHIVIAIKDRNK